MKFKELCTNFAYVTQIYDSEKPILTFYIDYWNSGNNQLINWLFGKNALINTIDNGRHTYLDFILP